MDEDTARPGQRRWRRWLAAGFDLVFPVRCAGCGGRGAEWCPECQRSLLRLEPPLCTRCGTSLAGQGLCPQCRGRPSALTAARSVARYQGPVCRAILQLKYRPNRRLAEVMGAWLAELYQGQDWQATAVVPVPLGRRRQRQRGYNQSALIASAAAQALSLPMLEGALRRVRETASQVGLDPAGRRQNVEGAFQADPALVRHQTLLLVDDLYTTGATLAACAAAAKACGAERVYALTVARAR